MLTKYERAELMGSLREMDRAWRRIPKGLRKDAAHVAYEEALRKVSSYLRTVIVHDNARREHVTTFRVTAPRADVVAYRAEKRKRTALGFIASKPRSLRELMIKLKQNRCSCAPGPLGRELRAWARAGLIIQDVSGRRGGKLWRVVSP